MSQAIATTYPPHPDYTEGTQTKKQPHYVCPPNQKTFGEKFYDFTNYGVIGYGAVLALSLYLTEVFMHGKGKKLWDLTDKPLSNMLAKSMDPEKAKGLSYSIHKYFYLTSGGNVLMLPMLWMENNKSKLTYLANRQFAPDTIAKDDPYLHTSATEILSSKFDENQLAQPVNEQPKHGILNAAWRRALAVAFISLPWAWGMNKTFGKDGVEKKTTKYLFEKMEASANPKMNELVKNQRFRNYAGWTAVDAVNTVITSLIIWATSGAKKGNGHENGNQQAPNKLPDNVPTREYTPSNTHTPPLASVQEPAILANSNHAQEKAPEDLVAYTNHTDAIEQRDQPTDPSLAV